MNELLKRRIAVRQHPCLVISMVLLLLPVSAAAQSSPWSRLAGVKPESTLATVRADLEPICGSLREVVIDPPNFPLARHSEIHLMCGKFEFQGLNLDLIALSFADDRLVLAYLNGDRESLLSLASKPTEEWMQFEVSWPEYLVIDGSAGKAWVMTPEAAHPNLFQWSNPYADTSQRIDYATNAERPRALQFGARLEDLKPLFEAQCSFQDLGRYNPWLLTRPEVQHQLDCYGVEFAGFPRKIEAVFGDGVLQQAWILTGEGEEERVRQALIEAWGEATYVDDDWEIFAKGDVMLRKDKPEVLMLSPALAPLFRAEYIDGVD